MKFKRLIFYPVLAAILLVAIILSLILPFQINIRAHDGFLSLKLGTVSADMAKNVPAWLQNYEYEPPVTTKIENNKYEINFGGEIITVGKGTNTFTPEITIYRWDKECYLTLLEPTINGEALSQKNAGTTLTSNTIDWASKDLEFKFYPVNQTEQSEFGALEYEIILANSKAGTSVLLNSISFPILTNSLEFNYQPALTQAEIDEGAYRPENVTGSYAVYHSTKRNHINGSVNYGTGKALHIYRPMLIDNQGDTIYADLTITSNELTIDFANISAWLNKAKYPVVIDPTFGYTGEGGSYETWAANDWVGLTATSSSDAATGTDWKIYQSAKMHTAGATGNCKGAIYLSSTNARVTNGIGGVSTQITASKAWVTSSYSTAPTISNSTDYKIGVVVGNASTGSFDLYFDNTGAGWYDTNITGGYSSPGTPVDPTSINRNHSVYASYTSASTLAMTNTPAIRAFGTLYNSQTYYSNNLTLGYAPTFPLADAQCYFTITNSGMASGNISAKATNFTGGTTLTLTDAAPGETTLRLSLYRSGDANSSANTTLTTTDRRFITSLPASATKKWEIKLETPTSDQNDANQKTCTITFTISSP